MILPLNIPAHQFFTDDELVAFSVANPELMVERVEYGQLFIKMTPSFTISSSNNNELITEIGIWNRKYKAGRVLESNGGFLGKIRPCACPIWPGQMGRWNALSRSEIRSFPHMVPDFVIELKSETYSLADLEMIWPNGFKRCEACLAHLSG